MSLSPITTVEKIKKTYREVDEETEDIIQLQMEYAALLVDKDIKNGALDADYREMAETYMTCHLLYMNYLKTSEDKISDTQDKKLTPKMGAGLQGSPYGQMYLSFYSMTGAIDDDRPVSGVGFLS
jgi:hypothetical protein